MPKDRLAAMQQKAGGDDEDFAVPVDDEMEGAMKDFFKEIEEIRSNCDKIDNKIKDVKKLQSEILSSPNVDQKMQSQMDDYMADIKKVANSVRTKYGTKFNLMETFNSSNILIRLKKMEQENDAEEKGRGSVTNELRMKKTQHMTASK